MPQRDSNKCQKLSYEIASYAVRLLKQKLAVFHCTITQIPKVSDVFLQVRQSELCKLLTTYLGIQKAFWKNYLQFFAQKVPENDPKIVGNMNIFPNFEVFSDSSCKIITNTYSYPHSSTTKQLGIKCVLEVNAFFNGMTLIRKS